MAWQLLPAGTFLLSLSKWSATGRFHWAAPHPTTNELLFRLCGAISTPRGPKKKKERRGFNVSLQCGFYSSVRSYYF